MAKVELIMPKMGESIIEATILKWVKSVGDSVEEDETILEIATDKVDSEVPSPVTGTIVEIKYEEDETIAVGEVIAIISTDTEDTEDIPSSATDTPTESATPSTSTSVMATSEETNKTLRVDTKGKFYSPLVRSIAAEEGISSEELAQIKGSGAKGRVTKKDIMAYVASHQTPTVTQSQVSSAPSLASFNTTAQPTSTDTAKDGSSEIIEMDRMRRLIAEHMVNSKRTSPHVTSFIEADVTDIVNWRNGIKEKFQQQYGEKITFTPIFMEAVVKAIMDFPMVNISLENNKIIKKNFINIGMATALPSGNLIVPVIKNADHLNLLGLTKSVNDLASRARKNQLKPEEIKGGTFTLTNVGTFGNVMGTPIINQPQVAILAIGAIRKKPAVLETSYGDVIAIRQMMFLSLSYDHRVVDGFLGGSFLRRIGDYLEEFDTSRQI